ncbi:MAG TPA: hypothetical protein VFH91_01465, partial [Pyrinomonadaceae bacterium]|nr:hypothetical protein [Pyrinomonadaceae bacterium]
KVQPTTEIHDATNGIPPTGVGGSLKSNLPEIHGATNGIPPTGVNGCLKFKLSSDGGTLFRRRLVGWILTNHQLPLVGFSGGVTQSL